MLVIVIIADGQCSQWPAKVIVITIFVVAHSLLEVQEQFFTSSDLGVQLACQNTADS